MDLGVYPFPPIFCCAVQLIIFNEKFENIKKFEFYKYITTHEEMGFTFNSNGNIGRNYPAEESLHAFILNFRFFIQDNEKSSLNNLSKIYNELPIHKMKKQSFFDIRKQINGVLNKYSNQNVAGKELTWRDIMEAVIFGKISHTTQKENYLKIAPDVPNREILNMRFIALMCTILALLEMIYYSNRNIINELISE